MKIKQFSKVIPKEFHQKILDEILELYGEKTSSKQESKRDQITYFDTMCKVIVKK